MASPSETGEPGMASPAMRDGQGGKGEGEDGEQISQQTAEAVRQGLVPALAVPVKPPKKPICVLVLGMAGAGKSVLMKRLIAHMYQKHQPPYVINLDPAVLETGYSCNIDIRDSVNYTDVMKEYVMGPNGAIITSLNLFATRFHEVVGHVVAARDAHEKRMEHVQGKKEREKETDSAGDASKEGTVGESTSVQGQAMPLVLVDTPGQIEVFMWSASGNVISDMLALSFPTVVLYVVDTPRTVKAPATFMSNMLYACSVMYKTRLPLILVFNKCDVVSHDIAVEWMEDYEAFCEALREDQSYMASLNQSMALVLDKFYSTLRHVGVSALSGMGMDDLLVKIDEAGDQYFDEYFPFILERAEKKIKALQAERDAAARHLRERVEEDMGVASSSNAGTRGSGPDIAEGANSGGADGIVSYSPAEQTIKAQQKHVRSTAIAQHRETDVAKDDGPRVQVGQVVSHAFTETSVDKAASSSGQAMEGDEKAKEEEPQRDDEDDSSSETDGEDTAPTGNDDMDDVLAVLGA